MEVLSCFGGILAAAGVATLRYWELICLVSVRENVTFSPQTECAFSICTIREVDTVQGRNVGDQLMMAFTQPCRATGHGRPWFPLPNPVVGP